MKEILIAILTITILALLFALPTMILWNSVLPDIFGISKITFPQAISITLLSRCLFGGVGVGSNKNE